MHVLTFTREPHWVERYPGSVSQPGQRLYLHVQNRQGIIGVPMTHNYSLYDQNICGSLGGSPYDLDKRPCDEQKEYDGMIVILLTGNHHNEHNQKPPKHLIDISDLYSEAGDAIVYL